MIPLVEPLPEVGTEAREVAQRLADAYARRISAIAAASETEPDATNAERVAAGVAWLDTIKPGWVERINVEDLDLTSCSWCVLGQVFGYFFGAPFFGDLDERSAILFARRIGAYPNAEFGDAASRTDELVDLTYLWANVIADRQAQTSRR